MNHQQRLKLFEKVNSQYNGFLASVLWKLTGDRELFGEAMQYALLGMWRHVEKLNSDSAGGYIYRIAITANSKAWRNRIGKNGQLPEGLLVSKTPVKDFQQDEMLKVKKCIAKLSEKQSRAIVMRYIDQKEYEEIASCLCCSEAAARSNVSKALAALKRRLSNG